MNVIPVHVALIAMHHGALLQTCFKCCIMSDMEGTHHSCIQGNEGEKPPVFVLLVESKVYFFLFG